ncbi:MAG: LysR family transcriptional regulator [Pseudomonadota bacterium]
MDRLTALRVFRTVVELGSFAAAARKLSFSPAAISKNISELEAHLSTRLINRTTRRMSLTAEGQLYFERVVQILDDLSDADGMLEATQSAPSGVLKVSAPMTVSLIGLSHAIPRFLAQHPDLTLDLNLDDRRVNLIEEGYDVALRASDTLESSGLIARKLMTMDHVLCAAPAYFEQFGYPATPNDLAQHNCLRFSLSGHAMTWSFQKGKRTEQIEVKGRYSVTSSLAIRDALRAGFGISLIPRMFVTDDLASGALVPALVEWSANETSLYAVYPSRSYVAPKVRAFLDFLVAQLGS